MREIFYCLCVVGFFAGAQGHAFAAESSGQKPNALNLGSPLQAVLSQDHLVQGLKEALAKGVEHSITNLSREGGYLNNLKVKIPVPERLAPVEKTLRKLKQDYLVDEFITNMNHAAELAVSEAGPIFSQAIRDMTLADAKSLLDGPEDAATRYFKKVSEKRLQQKMLPIIQKTTESAGATASYKQLMERASLGASFLKLKHPSIDLDAYVSQKATDGLFKMIAEEEKRIRQNPAARTTDLLQRVFGRR